jgi:hypothetical protein
MNEYSADLFTSFRKSVSAIISSQSQKSEQCSNRPLHIVILPQSLEDGRYYGQSANYASLLSQYLDVNPYPSYLVCVLVSPSSIPKL